MPFALAHQGRHDARGRFCQALRRRSGERHRHGGDSRGQASSSGRSAGRRSRPLLAADRRHYGLDITVDQPGDRPDVPLHDARPRRQDPHGLLQSVRDGAAWSNSRTSSTSPSATTPIPTGTGSSPGRCRADESQPLSGRRDSISADPPAGSGRRMPWCGKTLVSSGLIDRVVDEPGSDACEVPVGFKWFAPGCSTARSVSAARRAPGQASCARDGTVWTTDKDGPILDLLAAEITAPHRQGPRRALPRADRSVRHALLHADRCPGDARAEGPAGQAGSADRQGVRRWPASRSSPS